MSLRATSDHDRRIANLVEIGTVTGVNAADNTVTVDLGGIETIPLPVAQLRSGVICVHWMPSEGEQVAVLSPSGDLTRGFVVGSVPTADGAVAIDSEHPTIDLGGVTMVIRTGAIEITGPVTITGAVSITGDVEVTGKITASDDVKAGSISLKGHKHGQVQAGAAQSGAPV
jgi:phage baseplate assembly protein gpV